MKLIIGGACQGKREAACRLLGISPEEIEDGERCAAETVFSCRALCNFHRLILRKIQAGEDPAVFVQTMIQKNPELILISDEIGYGIVPMEKEDRIWREQTGRICCQVAEHADLVVRVVAGIPQILKGALS